MNLSQKNKWISFTILISVMVLLMSWTSEKGYADITYRYLLRVSTGNYDGENIGLVLLNYTDVNGSRRTYIFNPEEQLESTLEAAKDVLERDFSDIDASLEKMGYKRKGYQGADLFESFSSNFFILDLPYKVKEIEYISFMTDLGTTNTGKVAFWDCTGFEIYSMTDRGDGIKELVIQGTISGSYEIMFQGKLIAASGNPSGETQSFQLKVEDGKDHALTFRKNIKDESDLQLKTYTDSATYSPGSDYTDLEIVISMADTMGGGLDWFYGYRDGTDSLVNIPELMTMALTYIDSNGDQKRLEVPVLANALHQIYSMSDSSTNRFSELIGQDGSIYLKLRIYGYRSLVSSSTIANMEITYNPSSGSDSPAASAGFESDNTTSAAEHQAVISKMQTAQDSISIDGISIWETGKGETANVSLSVKNGAVLEANSNSNPKYNYCASTVDGTEVKPDKATNLFYMKEYTGGKLRPAAPAKQQYILVIHTTDLERAGTLGNIKVRLGYTVSRGGATLYTADYNLSDLVKAYYGSWPGKNGTDVGDVSYAMSVRPGGYAYALLSIDDILKFTSLTLTLEGTDDWQCDEFYIYQVGETALKERYVSWIKQVDSAKSTDSSTVYKNLKNSTSVTDRIVYRPFNKFMAETELSSSSLSVKSGGFQTTGNTGAISLVSVTDKVIYLDSEADSKTLDLDSQEIKTNTEDADWRDSDKFKEMSFEDTQKDMGFATKKVEYNIAVHVGTESYVAQNGDPGSANYFYFQLVFENGMSGIVQANQQLSADAFIAGEISTFTISTNYDYGEVKYVNVIPDDISSTADPYDKLKIDLIEVSRSDGDGASITWVCNTDESNQWVGIDYKEEAEATNGEARESRSISDIMRTYAITGKEMAADLLVSFNTGLYGNTNVTNVQKQLIASKLTAFFYVTKLDGSSAKIEVDMINAMYSYDKATAKKDSSGNTITDSETMLRESTWDTFIWKVTDILTIDKVEIQAETKESGRVYWKINEFRIDRITANYGYRLNAAGERVMDVATEVVTSATNLPKEINIASGQAGTCTIELQEQTGTVAEATTEAYLENRNPQTTNDYLNIIVYMEENGTDYSSVTLNTEVTFSNVYETYYQTSPTMKRTTVDGQTVYYATGVGARGMVSLTKMQVWADNKNTNGKFERAVVQHVRDGVVMETYYLGSLSGSLRYTQTLTSSGSVFDQEPEEYQVVTLCLGGDTTAFTLTPETEDVAVAIKYKLKTGTTTAEYQSPFIFLTDQDITKVGPNMILKLRFEQNNVKEITGIVVSVSGKEKSITLDSASIGMYEEAVGSLKNENLMSDSDEDFDCIGWYSVVAQKKIQAERVSFQVTSSTRGDYKAIVPMSITFKTMEANSSRNEMGLTSDADAELVIFYNGIDGETYVRTFSSIRELCLDASTSSFTTGHTDTIIFMEQNIRAITTVVIRPYDGDPDTVATWGIGSLTFSFGDGVDKTDFTIAVNEIAYENKETEQTIEDEKLNGLAIGVKDVIIEVNASTVNGHTGEIDTIRYVNGEGSEIPTIRLSSVDGEVRFTVKLTNTYAGATVRAGRTTKTDASSYLTTDGDEFVFTPPSKELTDEVIYTVEVISKENPAAISSFNVLVEKDLMKSGIKVSSKDIYQDEVLEVTFTMNKAVEEDTEIIYRVTTKFTESQSAGISNSYTAVILKDTDTVTVKPDTLPVGDYGVIDIQVLSVSGAANKDIDLSRTKTTVTVKSVGEVYVTAVGPSGSNTAKAGENVTISVAALTKTENDMTVTLLVNGKEETLRIPAGSTGGSSVAEATLIIEKPDSGTYTASIIKTEGGFKKTTATTSTASCTVGAATLENLSVESITTSKDSYDLGEDIVLNFRFDRVLEKDAKVKITLRGRSPVYVTCAAGTQEGTVTLSNLLYAEGSYAAAITEVTYYGTAISQSGIETTINVAKAVQESESVESTE